MSQVTPSSATGPVRVPRAVVRTSITGNTAIAAGAFWLSFTALADLAGRAGIPVSQAWVWPSIVDGMIVVATVSVMALESHGRRVTWFPWALLFAGAVVSVAGNSVHAALFGDADVPLPIRIAIAAVPPLVLLASTHLTVQLIRHSRALSLAEQPTIPAAASAPEAPDEEEPVDVDLRDEAIRLKEVMGWTNRRIAAVLEVHPSTVGRWLPPRPPAIEAAPERRAPADPEDEAVA
ncbi:MAG: excisionase [Microbacterium sp.]|nr:excisionase [Microbacterium sp.]